MKPQVVHNRRSYFSIMANIYLNELDWELAKANLEFVRYADDSIVMCQTKEDLEKAKVIVHETLQRLGLELAVR